MLDYDAAVAQMRKYFATYWGNETPISYDDVNFKRPNGNFVRFNIRHFDGFQASMGAPGNNLFRARGIATVQIFTLENDAGLEAARLAKLAKNAYIGKDTGEIFHYDTTIIELGNDDAGFYQINVKSTFEYDTTA